jgi:DMSO/TMAO reductase YedYZ heme-binding membrane subunit
VAGGRKTWLIALATAGALSICVTAALIPGSHKEQLSLATRLTARWAAVWFLLAFTARPLFEMFGGPFRELLRQRRYVGLGFASIHTIHGIAFVWLIASTDVSRPAIVWIVGGTGYLLMWAMAATSNDRAMRALGRNWKRLHTLGMWWLWFVFTYSYGGRIFRAGTETLGLVMAGLFVLAALIRIPAIRRLIGRNRIA